MSDVDLLARSLFDEMSTLVRDRRFEDFAANLHPLDLAKFKNLILAIFDRAHDSSDADEFCSQFDLVCFTRISCSGFISESYSVWTINDDEPAYAVLDKPGPLEQALREKHEEQKSSMIDLIKSISGIVDRFDEGRA